MTDIEIINRLLAAKCIDEEKENIENELYRKMVEVDEAAKRLRSRFDEDGYKKQDIK
jgi:hypothetical protein